jgi:hypothetical protein
VRLGDVVELSGSVYELTAIVGSTVTLLGRDGRRAAMTLTSLLADQTVRVLAVEPRRRPLRPEYFESLPKQAQERALWLERHFSEALDGVPVDAVPGAAPWPEFDPTPTSQRQRDTVKVAELAEAGTPVSLRAFQRYRQQYAVRGVEGLIDKRPVRRSTTTGRLDERYIAALRRVLAENVDASHAPRTKNRSAEDREAAP